MNGKKAKQLRRFIIGSKLSKEATYNVEGAQPYGKIETVYLTTQCERFFTQKIKREYKNARRSGIKW